ncbi:MAG: hypothetical protein RLO50_01990 [Azospirillaceae bacterium]
MDQDVEDLLLLVHRYVRAARLVLPEGHRPEDIPRLQQLFLSGGVEALEETPIPKRPSALSEEQVAWDILDRYIELERVLKDSDATRGQWAIALFAFMEAVVVATPSALTYEDAISGKRFRVRSKRGYEYRKYEQDKATRERNKKIGEFALNEMKKRGKNYSNAEAARKAVECLKLDIGTEMVTFIIEDYFEAKRRLALGIPAPAVQPENWLPLEYYNADRPPKQKRRSRKRRQ